MKWYVKIVGLAVIFLFVWNMDNPKGVVDSNHDTSDSVSVLYLDSIMGESGTYQYLFKKYTSEYVESLPEYQKIIMNSVEPGKCFEFKNVFGNDYVFVYDYQNCHEFGTDYKIAGAVINWKQNLKSVVTDKVVRVASDFNQPYYGNGVNIVITLDDRLAYSIEYYNRKGLIESVTFYLFTEYRGKPAYLVLTIDSDNLPK